MNLPPATMNNRDVWMRLRMYLATVSGLLVFMLAGPALAAPRLVTLLQKLDQLEYETFMLNPVPL